MAKLQLENLSTILGRFSSSRSVLPNRLSAAFLPPFHSPRASSLSEQDSVPAHDREGRRLRLRASRITRRLTPLLLSPGLPSPGTADHMGSYGPAFFQSYGASGQFTHEFDGDQLFSVDLKSGDVAWRLPEFGDFTHFDPQNGLASIATIRAHLDVLVERSNRTRATSGTCPRHPIQPSRRAREASPLPGLPPSGTSSLSQRPHSLEALGLPDPSVSLLPLPTLLSPAPLPSWSRGHHPRAPPACRCLRRKKCPLS